LPTVCFPGYRPKEGREPGASGKDKNNRKGKSKVKDPTLANDGPGWGTLLRLFPTFAKGGRMWATLR